MTYHRCVTRLTRRVSLVEQQLLTLPDNLSSHPVFSEVRVTRSLVLCVCFVDRCLSFCTFYFDHCVVCSSSIYGFWLSLWYLQTLLSHSLPRLDYGLSASQKKRWPRLSYVCRNEKNPQQILGSLWPVTVFVTIISRRVSLVEQKLLTLPSTNKLPVLIEVRVAQSLIFFILVSIIFQLNIVTISFFCG